MAPRRCGLFNSDQNILLVGEGDLSFALSLARKFGGRRITATTFNSQVGSSGLRSSPFQLDVGICWGYVRWGYVLWGLVGGDAVEVR
jgi:hypothetical protein